MALLAPVPGFASNAAMRVMQTQDDLAAAVGALARREPRFALVLARHGVPALRRMPEGHASLLRIVTDQLISLKAAAAIWQRLTAAHPGLDAAALARAPEAELRGLGLSGAKARSFRAIATAVVSGQLDMPGLAALDDEAVLTRLTAVHGIGPWTAQIYLLMGLGRGDGWPAGDLALQIAAQDLFGLPGRPAAREMVAMAEAWRPWRGAAAHLLWRHYREMRGIAPA
ncbi:MAG: DNA-3-methyladenine glycosylase 2 family protein [Hyphomicrobiales bacterium]